MIMCEKFLCREVQGYGDISQGFLSRYINVKNDTVPAYRIKRNPTPVSGNLNLNKGPYLPTYCTGSVAGKP